MRVGRREPVAVVEDDKHPVATHPSRKDHGAGRRGADRGTPWHRDVDAGVEFTGAEDGVDPPAVARADPSLNGPQERSASKRRDRAGVHAARGLPDYLRDAERFRLELADRFFLSHSLCADPDEEIAALGGEPGGLRAADNPLRLLRGEMALAFGQRR